jgi:hypothetical protein
MPVFASAGQDADLQFIGLFHSTEQELSTAVVQALLLAKHAPHLSYLFFDKASLFSQEMRNSFARSDRSSPHAANM